jgi:hypothetical protein
MSDYIFSIASQDKRNVGEEFRVFRLDGEDVIGVEEKEPFELRFRNNTNQPVQIRLSVDGTDVLSGKPASTKPTGEMFLVSPYDSMSLRAWPESMQGGARFVFTTTEKSVAVNTHGNTSGIGLIAAAIYTDYYSTPTVFSPMFQSNSLRFARDSRRSLMADKRMKGRSYGSGTKGATLGGDVTKGVSLDFCAAPASSDSLGDIAEMSNMAVGAGEYTDQTLIKAAGLRRPVLDEVIQVRYLPWEKLRHLVAKEVVGVTAFPGDQQPGIDLSKVPRTKSTARRQPEIYRFL